MSEATKAAIESMEAWIIEELSPVDIEERVRKLYDVQFDGNELANVCGVRPSRIIEELSPTTFRCACADYSGASDDLYEIGDEYYDRREVDSKAEEYIEELDTELEDMEEERDEIEADGDSDDAGRLAELKALIAEMAEKIAACNRHAW